MMLQRSCRASIAPMKAMSRLERALLELELDETVPKRVSRLLDIPGTQA